MHTNMRSRDLANICRKDIVKMTSIGNSAHVGSCLSCVDILSVLYSDILKIDPQNPLKKERDIFIMSKGHAGAALYCILARKGFFDATLLSTHYKNGSNLSGHVNSHLIKGIEVSTGSLGNGLGIACGFAYAKKLIESKDRVFVLISDGEINEGSTWEAILFAAHHNLDNLTCILDANGLQSIKSTTKTLNVEPLQEKIEKFDWNTIEIDGHNHKILKSSLKNEFKNKPKFIIARTIKGKGISFMENKPLWHYRNAKGEELIKALEELS